MKIKEIDNSVIVSEYDSFDIAAILECGQCFRFSKTNENNYRITAFGRILNIKQNFDLNLIEFFPTNLLEFNSIWRDYFNFDTNYMKIKDEISADPTMKEAVAYSPGLRHLRQEVFETLISFIVSQNNRIPKIMKSVELISQKFGKEINEGVFSFPTPEEMSGATLEELRECKVGFRDKYILDAVEKVVRGEVCVNRSNNMSDDELREHLKTIKGVGNKVADCVMLFAYGRTGVYPTDTWIIKATEYFYFNSEKTNLKSISQFASEKFGKYAGMANQYLFHYARTRMNNVL